MARDDRDTEADDTPALEIAIRLERLSRLLRQAGHSHGLVPAQWDVLRYLARANRLSRSPGQVARYLGTTKGTVSQSLLTLEKKGLIQRHGNGSDKRHVSLTLTQAGRLRLEGDPLRALATDLEQLGGKTRRRFARGLAELLTMEIGRQGAARFGTCAACARLDAGGTCAADGVRVTPEEQVLLCAAFSPD